MWTNVKDLKTKQLEAYAQSRFPAYGQPIPQEQPQQQQSVITPRKKLMQQINPAPFRDVAEEERLKKLAKVNAFGRIIGGLGQMAGMAGGGDAVMIQDNMSPFITNRFLSLDADYRDQLRQNLNRAFQIELQNNELENRDIADQNDYNARMSAIEATGRNQMAVQQERARAAQEQFAMKTREEQAKAMREVGINPNDPNAVQKYLQATGKAFDADVRLKNARANWNNRVTRSSGGGSGQPLTDPEFFALVKKGYNIRKGQIQSEIDRLNTEINSNTGTIMDRQAKAEQVKELRKSLQELPKINVNERSLQASELADLAMMEDGSQPEAPSAPQWQGNYVQGGGLRMPDQQVDFNEVIQEGVNTIIRPDFRFLDPVQQGQVIMTLTEAMLASGKVETEEEAEEWIRRIIDGEDFE